MKKEREGELLVVPQAYYLRKRSYYAWEGDFGGGRGGGRKPCLATEAAASLLGLLLLQ